MKGCLGKGTGELLPDDVFAVFGGQRGEFLGQLGAGGEDGGAGGDGVADVDDFAVGGAVFLKQGGNYGARGFGVCDFEGAFGYALAYNLFSSRWRRKSPLAYSFCASMMMRAESEGEAVEGCAPTS